MPTLPRHTLPAALILVGLALPMMALAQTMVDYLGAVPAPVQNPPQVVQTTCANCHGLHGVSPIPTYPNLAGQNYGYLLKQLEDFSSGKRSDSAIMTAMVKTIPSADQHQNLKHVAAYFAQQQASAPAPAGQPRAIALSKARAELGYRLYAYGDREKNLPACGACHMMNGRGNAPMAVPALAGQDASYVQAQLQVFASGKRSNSPNGVMKLIAARLDAEQIAALSAYVESMQPRLLPGDGPKTYEAYDDALKTQAVPGIATSALAPPKGK